MCLPVICRHALEYKSICADRTSHDDKELPISMAVFLIYLGPYSSSHDLIWLIFPFDYYSFWLYTLTSI